MIFSLCSRWARPISRRSRSRCARSSKKICPSLALNCRPPRRASASSPSTRALRSSLSTTWSRRRSRGSRRPRHRRLHPGRVHRSMPRTASAQHRQSSAPAPSSYQSGGALLARRPSTTAQLTRVYGAAFANKDELAVYLEQLELARQRDHRRIGRRPRPLQLSRRGFRAFPSSMPGACGVWNAIHRLLAGRAHQAGYEEIRTPQILRRELWELKWPLEKLQRQHVLHRDRRSAVRREANELPRRPAYIQEPPAQLPRTCRCAWPNSARCIATR